MEADIPYTHSTQNQHSIVSMSDKRERGHRTSSRRRSYMAYAIFDILIVGSLNIYAFLHKEN